MDLSSVTNLPITSVDITLQKIVTEQQLYNIPIYQRLYVWGDDQIKTLLDDLYKAFEEKQPKYYLGGVMVTENNDKLDLIDGQQRFTTLWLISKILGGDLSKFTNVVIDKTAKSRMSFAVRDFANHYFNAIDSTIALTPHEIEELQPIYSAESVIKAYINGLLIEEDKREKFASFIYKQVYLVSTKMPQNTDENKVFEAMNNRGVQLQQHEILKSKLLKKLSSDKSEMHRYALLWDACCMMDDYLEKNIKLVANLVWTELFPSTTADDVTVQLPRDIHSCLKSNSENKISAQLLSILEEDKISEEEKRAKENTSKKDIEDYDSGKVRSIINFPILLLHTLRIYQFRYNKIEESEYSAEVKGKDLIKIFDKFEDYFKSAQEVKNFINLLWVIREKFDRHVIKWIGNEENKEEIHLIKRLYQSKTAFQRKAPITNEGFALLQSMLYHSQQIITHYWLTPFLNKMLTVDEPEELYSYLEKLDNAMFCSAKADLRTMSYEMMSKKDDELRGDTNFVEKTLNDSLGTSYPSYWFYKMDYVLWTKRAELNRSNWEDFRMTAKNSVEHISPQNPKPEDTNIVFDHSDDKETIRKKKDDFGNLVLLAPGMNSEYSNKPFNVKRTEFNNKIRLDSLKSDVIFKNENENENWNWKLCQDHRDKMISLFKKHLQ